jgi:capsular polysaccharide export protein
MGLRSFLFLQGTASPFFSTFSNKLNDIGFQHYRVNFCGGDQLFSTGSNSWNYTDAPKHFSQWLSAKLNTHRITDIILFGDARPLHAQAIKLAAEQHINVHVFEEGYLRPNWLTLEKNGANANSSLPRDPQWYLDYAHSITHVKQRSETGYRLKVRAWHDVRYHISSFFQRKTFPYYRTHRPRAPMTEYLGWMYRFPTLLVHEQRNKQTIKKLVDSKEAFYLFPLQLNADVQIRIHSSFSNIKAVIQRVLTSFAEHAPANSKIVIKNHPLDTGLERYSRYLKKLSKELGIVGRVIYMETGNLPLLLDAAKGTVLVNSTVGMTALLHDCPTCVLGTAIYDLKGLTFQGGLNDFWQQGTAPDKILCQAFQKTVIHLTQINGDFYTQKGIGMAVDACIDHLALESTKAAVTTTKKRSDYTDMLQADRIFAKERI